jgi:hypothetical protein
MTRLPAPGRIIEVMLSSRRRSRNAAMRIAMARPLTGSHPRLLVRLNTAVINVSVALKTSMARIDCRTSPSRASNQLTPHCLGRPGMIHMHAKKTPTTSSNKHPTNAIRAVNAKPMLKKANIVAAIAASVSTPTRPNGLSPFAHFTVAASSPPSALARSLSM